MVKTKKQVVKLYAIARWSRDADVVQKAMVRWVPALVFSLKIKFVEHQNITAFLMDQNRQFQVAVDRLNYAKESLDPARSGMSGNPVSHRD